MQYNESLIDRGHLLDLNKPSPIEETASVNGASDQTLAEQVEEFEKKIIIKTLKRNSGNKTATAKALGLSVRNLYYKLEKYKFANNGMQ